MNTQNSGTVKLARMMLRRSLQLIRCSIVNPSVPDMYRAIGMASELIDDADRLICSLPDSAVIGQRKTFEELTGKKVRSMAAGAK